ncbi:MAG: cyanophycin synthetase, partial [Patescibacteria group bacterium]
WRRFDYMGITKNNSLVYNDYAHHPNEIKAVIQGAREKHPDKKLIVVFQPHLYSRTKIFLNDFKKALNMADKIIITDIYAAREKNDESIHAKDLLIKKSKYIKETKNIIKELKQKKDSIILIIGAGDVYKIGEKLVDKNKRW